MTETTGLVPTTRFGRLERRGVLLGLSGVQVALLGVALAALVCGLYTRGAVGLLISSVLWLPLAAVGMLRFAGRSLTGWLPIATQWAARSLTSQTNYRITLRKGRSATGTLALPGDAARLRLVETDSGAALVHDPADRSLTVVAKISAPAYDLATVDDQRSRVTGWGRLLAGLTPASGVQRVQALARTVPETNENLQRYWMQHGIRDGSWAAQVVGDLITTAPARARHEAYLAISLQVHRPADLGATARAAERQMAATAAAADRAGLVIEHWLDKATLCRLVRTAYDPTAVPTTTGTTAVAGPVGVDEEWDKVRTDGTVHVVYWIAEWPRDEVAANFLHPLVFAGVTHAISIIAEPRSATAALREIRKAKADHVADAAQRARMGQLEDEALSEEAAEVIAREKELAAGHAVLDFTGLLVVSASDAEQLDSSCAELELAAAQAGCELRRLVGQQAQALAAAALPFGRGLL